MAMKRKRLTKDEALNLTQEDLLSADRGELSSYVRVLADVANKRIKRLEESGLYKISQTYQNLSAEKFTTKGKTEQQLRNEYMRARQFLGNKSSTVGGVRKIKADLEKNLFEVVLESTSRKLRKEGKELSKSDIQKAMKKLTVDEVSNFWELLKHMRKSNTSMYHILSFYRVTEIALKYTDRSLGEDMDSILRDEMTKMYLQIQEEDREYLENEGKGTWLKSE